MHKTEGNNKREDQRRLQENWKCQGNTSPKDEHDKRQKRKRPVDVEEIKKRWKEYMQELYKKDLNEPDNHDGVVSHPEPDLLEYEVKWALGSTAVSKASGCSEISVELFKTLKDDAIKVLHSICQQIWKTQQWPQDWKRSTRIPVPKKVVLKNVLTIGHSLISHASKVMLKILHARLQHGLPWSDDKESAFNVGDLGSIPGLGRSPGGRHGNPFQYSCMENPHRLRSLAGCSSWGSQRVGHN